MPACPVIISFAKEETSPPMTVADPDDALVTSPVWLFPKTNSLIKTKPLEVSVVSMYDTIDEGQDVLIEGSYVPRGGLRGQQGHKSSCVPDAQYRRIRHYLYTTVSTACA
jgi:hypothetical protein